MRDALMRYGWKKERVLPSKNGSVIVRYRLGTRKKVKRSEARASLERLGQVLEAKKSIESVYFTELSGRLDHMGVGIWKITLMVELAGIGQDNFFHLLSVE